MTICTGNIGETIVNSSMYLERARSLLLEQKQGILSTNHVNMHGYPYATAVSYCLDRQGRPVIAVPQMAQEMENIKADHKVSLAISGNLSDSRDGDTALHCLSKAQDISGQQDSIDRYYHYFSGNRHFMQMNDPVFYYLEFMQIQYQETSGQTLWFDLEGLITSNPFSAIVEKRIITHMTEEQQPALRHYLAGVKNCTLEEREFVKMVGIDGEGFDLRVRERFFRIPFNSPVSSLLQARRLLMEMARR